MEWIYALLGFLIGSGFTQAYFKKNFAAIAKEKGYVHKSQLDSLKKYYKQSLKKLEKILHGTSTNINIKTHSINHTDSSIPITKQIEKLEQDYAAGKMSIDEYRRRMDNLFDQL